MWKNDWFLNMRLNIVAISIFLVTLSFESNAFTVKLMSDLHHQIDAPEIKLLDGDKVVSLKNYKGNFILVNFWATWCPTCVAEMGSLDRLAIKLDNKKFKVIGINLNEGGKSEVQNFLSEMKFKKMIILFDSLGISNKAFSILGLPTTYLISPEGKLVAKLHGPTKWDDQKVITQIENLILNSI